MIKTPEVTSIGSTCDSSVSISVQIIDAFCFKSALSALSHSEEKNVIITFSEDGLEIVSDFGGTDQTYYLYHFSISYEDLSCYIFECNRDKYSIKLNLLELISTINKGQRKKRMAFELKKGNFIVWCETTDVKSRLSYEVAKPAEIKKPNIDLTKNFYHVSNGTLIPILSDVDEVEIRSANFNGRRGQGFQITPKEIERTVFIQRECMNGSIRKRKDIEDDRICILINKKMCNLIKSCCKSATETSFTSKLQGNETQESFFLIMKFSVSYFGDLFFVIERKKS